MNETLSQHIKILQGATSPNKDMIQATYDYISSTPEPILAELSCLTILLNEEVPIVAVQLSFIILNRIKFFLSSRWGNFNPDQRDLMKEALIRGIRSPDIAIRNFAAVVFAYVVEADKKIGNDDDLIKIITSDIVNEEIENQNKIGFIFAMNELIQLKVISPLTKNIEYSCTVFIQYFLYILTYPYEFPKNIFISIISCYNTIFPFYEKYVNNPQIIASILNLIQADLENELSPDFHDSLYLFLFTLVRTCYTNIINNMEQIFQISRSSFSKPDVGLVIPSIRFWNEVSNYEFQLLKEKERNIKITGEDNTIIHNITLVVSPSLLQPIVEFIIQTARETPPSEIAEEEYPCYEAAKALRSFGQLSLCVFEFVKNNFVQMSESEDWKVRHAAVTLLWCITESPNTFEQINFFSENFGKIVSMVEDRSYAVDDTSLWIIELILKKYKSIATNKDFLNILQIIICKAPFAPLFLSTRICDIVNKLGKSFEKIRDHNSSYEEGYPIIIDSMLKTLEREDAPNSILGFHCAEALSSLILAAPKNHEHIITNILHLANDQIKAEFTRQDIVPREYIQMKIQFYCTLIWASVKRLQFSIEPFSDPLINTLLALLNKKSVICQQEGLWALSEIINVLTTKVQPFVPQIIQICIISQESHMKEIVEMSSCVILSLFQSLNMFMATDMENNKKIFDIFIRNLQDQDLHISPKIQILFAMAEMIKVLKSEMMIVYPTFVSQLTTFQYLVYDKQLGRDNTCMLCMALLKGYSSLIEASFDTDYVYTIKSNYRQITRLFEAMASFKEDMTEGLKVAIIDYLSVVLDKISKIVNAFLHKNCVRSLVEYIYLEDVSTPLAFRASNVLKRLEKC